ncbi:SGNH/GDSL hydrolase family protein [Sphingomonas sp. ABOLD]|nr:SGNH/GDSL hydrolase family protein [Sphingomonas sp. ABOLE]RSV40949.1 SGNH/GDSL hydrolase family protein [Sphingomonas sp. ABOLD]
MSVNDTFASAAVRSGFAAPVDPADFATLNVGGPLDPGTPTEIALEDGVSKRMRRIAVPASVAAIAISLGVGASIGKPISATPLPTLTLTPTSASIPANTAAGYQLFAIGNVPAGVTPTISPNDGRFVISGSAGTGWVAVVGLSALSAGSVDIAVSAAGANGASFALTVTAASSVTFQFPAVQAKMAAGQRSQIAIVGDSAVAGWGGGVDSGTGAASQSTAGNAPGNYLRNKSWPAQLKDMLIARGVPCRHDAFFTSQPDSSVANMQAANPNIVIGTGWTLTNYSLSGSMLNCPNTVTTPITFTPEIAADSFDIIHSATAGLGIIVVQDEDGLNVQINEGTNSGAQVVTASGNGMKRTTITRPVASTKPITITRVSGGQVFLVGIIPYNSTSPCLEILNLGWPGAKAFGTNGTGHWNIYSDPSTMTAATPYNALGALNSDAYIIELGTNDANQAVTATDFQTAMTNIATKLKGQAGGNGANVALVKCRVAMTGGYNMSSEMLAVIDTVTANLSLAPVINYNVIPFVTTDRFDGTHLSAQGYAKEATVARQSMIGS